MGTRYVTIIVLSMMAGVLLAAPGRCWAVEEEQEDIWAGDTPRLGPGRAELTEERIDRILNRLKETDPKKAEELAKLRETDPEKFKAELGNVMREQVGKRMREHKGPKDQGKGCPASPPPPCMAPPGGPGGLKGKEGMGGERGGPMEMHERHAEYLEWLGKNYPEDANELAGLKGKNPELYDRQVGLFQRKHRRIFEAAKENPELAEVLKENLKLSKEQHELIKKIKAATDNNEKKNLTEQLENVVGKKFDLLVKRKQMAYEQMLKRLEELKKEVQKSEAQVEKWKDSKFKSDSVKARVKELVSGDEKFDWDRDTI